MEDDDNLSSNLQNSYSSRAGFHQYRHVQTTVMREKLTDTSDIVHDQLANYQESIQLG